VPARLVQDINSVLEGRQRKAWKARVAGLLLALTILSVFGYTSIQNAVRSEVQKMRPVILTEAETQAERMIATEVPKAVDQVRETAVQRLEAALEATDRRKQQEIEQIYDRHREVAMNYAQDRESALGHFQSMPSSASALAFSANDLAGLSVSQLDALRITGPTGNSAVLANIVLPGVSDKSLTLPSLGGGECYNSALLTLSSPGIVSASNIVHAGGCNGLTIPVPPLSKAALDGIQGLTVPSNSVTQFH
jgi:hypothetical protein